MTREIALHCMKSASELERELCEECPIYGQTGSDHCFEDALQYVIGMLEQEPILDKIRAEIEQTRKMYLDMNDIDWLNGCDYVLSVINKYKAESEE